MDFTLNTYIEILKSFINQGYKIQSIKEYFNDPQSRTVILRHDVDRLPENALNMALIENKLDIKATYYFRIIPKVFNEKIIKEIYSLDHDIGYHYEDLTLAKGNIDKAYELFCENLEKFRKIVPISTICMHGSPTNKWDNKIIWHKYNYKNLNIICEPYFDINYNEFFYITDTGRKWNNKNYNVRDIVKSSYDIKINSSKHLIMLIEKNNLPDKILLNIHPHRWFNFGINWLSELIFQNIKNIMKHLIIKNYKK